MKMLTVIGGFLCLLMSTANAFSQSVNGSVGGIIEDSSHALIPGVTATLTNTETGVVATVLSNESGAYNFTSVPPGRYKLTAGLQGFKTGAYDDVGVGASAQVRLNFTLQIGNASTQVEVSVSSQQLLTESSASIGDVLSSTKLKELPSVNGDALDLTRIEPGLRFPPQGAQFATLTGLPVETVNTVRDGLSVTDGRNTNGIFSVTTINPDMVGEIRVILNPVDAEVGRGNGQVQISTRSGTNKYTGSAVWNIRNTALAANTWANNQTLDVTGAWHPTPLDWRNGNQYTISFGGPIIKNKTFFFALWDHNITNTRQLISNTVLTDTARQGIFRYFTGWNSGNALTPIPTFPANATTGTYPVIDATGAPVAPAYNPDGSPYTGGLRCYSVFGTTKADGSPFTAADCPGGTALFPGGSATAWDTLRPAMDSTGYIQRILSLMPHANFFSPGGTTIDGLNIAQNRYVRGRSGNTGAGAQNGTSPSLTGRKQINVKIDHNVSARHRLSVGWSYEQDDNADNVANWPGGINGESFRRPQVLTANFTSTLSPALVNEARFGISGYGEQNVVPPWFSSDPAVAAAANDLLLQGGTASNGVVLPVAFTPGAGNFAFGNHVINNASTYSGSNAPLYDFADTFSWTRGKHGFKFGGELRLTRSSGFSGAVLPTASGGAGGNTSALSGAITALPNQLAATRTNAANMLYLLNGSVNTASQLYWVASPSDVENGTWQDYSTSNQRLRTTVQNEGDFFFKDDWKATRSLTFNLGLRWEYYGSPYLQGGYTAAVVGQGLGLFGNNVGSAASPFDRWLAPGNTYLTGYGNGVTAANALVCAPGVTQSALLPVSTCDPSKLTTIEFVGPGSPNPDKKAIPSDLNNFGPAIGFSWQVPWFGVGKTIVRGGFQTTFGGPGRNGNALDNVLGNLPGNSSTATTVTSDFATTTHAIQLSDMSVLVPVRPTSPAVPGGQIPIYNRATAFTAYDPSYATPYVNNITFSVTRNVARNITVDVRYIGALGRKRAGSINLNTTDVYHNQELFDALTVTRAGGDAPLFDQMLAGLNLNTASGATTSPTGLTYGPVGSVTGGVLQTGSAALRRLTTFAANIANGNFDAVASSLNTLSLTGITGGESSPIATGVGGAVLRNGCNRIADGKYNPALPANTTTNIPTRCFAEDYIVANPQLSTATYMANLAQSTYHSLQAQVSMRPIQGVSFQATYTKAKNLVYVPGAWNDPLNRRADYTESPSSIHNNFTSNGTFELPIGPNKLLFGNSSGWAARIIERWSASIIYIVGNGPRRTIPAGRTTYATGTNTLDVGQQKAVIVDPTFDNNEKGAVVWNGRFGQFYTPLVQVTDPQCALTDHVDTMGFNLAANCTLSALAKVNPDGTAGAIQLQNSTPGKTGNFGLDRATSGKYELNANVSKTFRISESKSLSIRVDAQNFLNHADPGDADGLATGDSINTSGLNFGQIQAKAYSNSGGGARSFVGQVRFTF
jgi:hypothetical protein